MMRTKESAPSLPGTKACFTFLTVSFVLSRLVWYAAGVRFDMEPLRFYIQYADPYLLRTDFWRTMLYFEQQPPVYNFYLGAVLKLFPAHPGAAFAATHVVLGLALCLSLFALLERIGVDRRIALAIGLVFTLSPTLVLYENLLFYEYALATLFCCAALFLHRYIANSRFLDGMLFFGCMGLLAGIRSIYHLAWFAALVFFVGAASRHWRRTILVAALPGVLLASFYLKNFILFRSIVPGADVQGGFNFAHMSSLHVPPGVLEPLIASGSISRMLTGGACLVTPYPAHDYNSYPVRHPPPTHIPILDSCMKTTGAANYNCRLLAEIGRVCGKDSSVVFRSYPREYFRSVADNILQYFRPSTDGWPFDGRPRGRNWEIVSLPLRIENLLTAGEHWRLLDRPWLNYVAFPLLITFGLLKVGRHAGALFKVRRRALSATEVTLIFALFNILYLSAAVILLAFSDHNRYRIEVSSFYALLFGLWISELIAWYRARRTKREDGMLSAVWRIVPIRPSLINR